LLTGSSDLPGDHRTGRPVPLFGLAPCGVLPATRVTTGAVRSYRTFSPLPPVRGADDGGRESLEEARNRFFTATAEQRFPTPVATIPDPHHRDPYRRRYVFCATVLQVALTGRYPAHCPAEFGLSSRLRALRRFGAAAVWLTATSRLYPWSVGQIGPWGGRGGPMGTSVPHSAPIRPSPGWSGTARASCTDCCAACRSPQRSSRCSSHSRGACRPGTSARRSP